MSYELLVLDLDGTLTNSKKEITEPTKRALLEIQSDGKKSSWLPVVRNREFFRWQRNYNWKNTAVTSCLTTAGASVSAKLRKSFITSCCRIGSSNRFTKS